MPKGENARLLVVSPHFPPVDAVDMHRVRHGVNYYDAYGWRPTVLCIDPAYTGRLTVPDLLKTIPDDLEVHRVRPTPLRLSQSLGVRSLAIRSFLTMYRAGSKLLRRRKYDLVFFSTTSFLLMPLGRIWRHQYGVPYVLDIQDPWASDYTGEGRSERTGAKHELMRAIHRRLERWTVPCASGIIAVSQGYIDTLRQRYPPVRAMPSREIPFGLLPQDFAVAEDWPLPAIIKNAKPGGLRGVYMGALGGAMKPAIRALLRAWRMGRDTYGEPFTSMQMFFVGTSYAEADAAAETVMPIARELNLQDSCFEQTARVPYFQALRSLQTADFLVLPTSDAAGYVPSKLLPLLYLKKPITAVCHNESSTERVLRDLPSVALLTLPEYGESDRLVPFVENIRDVLVGLAAKQFEPQLRLLERQMAENVARAECEVFAQAIAQSKLP